jgi:hypothetical protein
MFTPARDFLPPKARQAQKPTQKNQECQKSSARGNFKTAPKQEKITNARVLVT